REVGVQPGDVVEEGARAAAKREAGRVARVAVEQRQRDASVPERDQRAAEVGRRLPARGGRTGGGRHVRGGLQQRLLLAGVDLRGGRKRAQEARTLRAVAGRDARGREA